MAKKLELKLLDWRFLCGIIIIIASIYTCLETAIAGYFEYTNNNKFVGIILYVLAVFCLVAPIIAS